MKILFVHDHIFLTNKGNVYSNVFSYAILKRYIDVFSQISVLARCREVGESQGVPLASGEGVNFIFLENISTLRSYFGLRQQHEKRIAHLVQAHEGVIVRVPSELGLMTAAIAQKLHKKCLTEVVGCAWDIMWNYGGWRSKLYAPLFYLKMKKVVKRSNRVTYVTKQFLQTRYPPANGARTAAISDVELPNMSEATLLYRIEKIKNREEKIIFATIGTLNVKFKGIENALKALSSLKNTIDFEYHILGEGDSSMLQSLARKLGIEEQLFFDGTLTHGSKVFDWLDSADIYLQPSLAEGLPRSLVEAMSRGCPAIGSSVGGIPELLGEEMLFSSDSPEALSEKIRMLMLDKVWMTALSNYNFSTAKEYQKSLLDTKRSDFWNNFKEEIICVASESNISSSRDKDAPNNRSGRDSLEDQ